MPNRTIPEELDNLRHTAANVSLSNDDWKYLRRKAYAKGYTNKKGEPIVSQALRDLVAADRAKDNSRESLTKIITEKEANIIREQSELAEYVERLKQLDLVATANIEKEANVDGVVNSNAFQDALKYASIQLTHVLINQSRIDDKMLKRSAETLQESYGVPLDTVKGMLEKLVKAQEQDDKWRHDNGY
jgi:hypothetical protein